MVDEKKIGVGVGVMLLKKGKILLGRRHEDPEKARSALRGEGTWCMPGGKMRFGETFEETGKREVLEETGIVVNSAKIIALNNDQIEGVQFITIGLLCEDFDGESQVREPDTITCWDWFDLDALPSPLFFPSEKILKNYLQKQFYIS